MTHRSILAAATLALALPALAGAADAPPPAAPAKPIIAKICTNCHKAEAGSLRGYLDNFSAKSNVLQVKMDDSVEVLNFDMKGLQVTTDDRRQGDGDLLKNNAVKKGHDVRIEYTENKGVKTAVRLTAKPPVELPKEMLISTDELEKLVARGPQQASYHLFDSRPAPRFQEGAIPTAVNLPFPAFDKLADKLLPADKNALLIFYCSGVTCNMSPGSATKARKLGYINIKVYKEGMPGWSEKHFGVLSAQSLKEAWIDKGVSHVLLDARPKKGLKEFIGGAVSFPAASAAKLAKGLDLKQKKAPIIVYDAGSGKDAAVVAAQLLKGGYGNIKVVSGGYAAWKDAGYQIASGQPATRVAYVPKLKQGEIDVEQFKQYAASLPGNVMIVDVRLPEETRAGMITNAKALPLVELRERAAAELPKDKTIVLQCNTGTQAEIAYNTLRELGYTEVKYLNAKVTFGKDGGYTIAKE